MCLGDVTVRTARVTLAPRRSSLPHCPCNKGNTPPTLVHNGCSNLGRPRPVCHLPRGRLRLDAFASRDRAPARPGSSWRPSSMYVLLSDSDPPGLTHLHTGYDVSLFRVPGSSTQLETAFRQIEPSPTPRSNPSRKQWIPV